MLPHPDAPAVVSAGSSYRKCRKGPPPRTLAEVAAGIISRTVPGEDGCLLFTGTLTPKGYGMVLARGLSDKPLYVHRVVLAAAHGLPLIGPWAGGRESSHTCARKACVNIAHLVAETHAENMARIPRNQGGRPTFFDTEAIAGEIERDGIWQVIVRHQMSYQHAMRIRGGWRPKKPYCPSPAVLDESVA